MVDNLQRTAEPVKFPLECNVVASNNRSSLSLVKTMAANDRDVMSHSYDSSRVSAIASGVQSVLKVANKPRKKKLEEFLNLEDSGDESPNSGSDIALAALGARPHIPLSGHKLSVDRSEIRGANVLILPPKKTIKLEPIDMRARQTDARNFGAQPEETQDDVPINLCIKTEHCDNAQPSNSISGSNATSMKEPYNRNTARFPIPTPNPSVIPEYVDSQGESPCDISSQESTHNTSRYTLSGSSQESSPTSTHAMSFSSQESIHVSSHSKLGSSQKKVPLYNNTSFSQDSAHSSQSLPVWCEEDNINVAGNFLENAMQLSRLERRRQQNREAARRLREKRKKCLDRVYEERREFENQLINLQLENQRLKQRLKPNDTDDEKLSELEKLRRENVELREQLKEHHECKLRMEKLQQESNELRFELYEALKENKRLHNLIESHQEQCSHAF